MEQLHKKLEKCPQRGSLYPYPDHLWMDAVSRVVAPRPFPEAVLLVEPYKHYLEEVLENGLDVAEPHP